MQSRYSNRADRIYIMTNQIDAFRFDFNLEVVSFDEETKHLTLKLTPDPRRYQWCERDGERLLYDRFDDIFIPKNVLKDLFDQSLRMPMHSQIPKIDNVDEYIASRRTAVDSMLKGESTQIAFEDKSEEYLQSLEINRLEFVILSIDIVGSTKMATTMSPESYLTLISTILYEMSSVVPKYYGHVLKYTGDGLIAYFPAPSLMFKNDAAISCAVTIHRLMYFAMNQALKERGFPEVEIRMGLDAGEAFIEIIGSAETKRHKDIIGGVVSLAAKIQSLARPGCIYFGETVERNLHVTWREFSETVDPGESWPYENYGVRKLNLMTYYSKVL